MSLCVRVYAASQAFLAHHCVLQHKTLQMQNCLALDSLLPAPVKLSQAWDPTPPPRSNAELGGHPVPIAVGSAWSTIASRIKCSKSSCLVDVSKGFVLLRNFLNLGPARTSGEAWSVLEAERGGHLRKVRDSKNPIAAAVVLV